MLGVDESQGPISPHTSLHLQGHTAIRVAFMLSVHLIRSPGDYSNKTQTQTPNSTLPYNKLVLRLHVAFTCFICCFKDVRRMSWPSSDLQAVHCLFTSTAAVHASVECDQHL